MWPTPVQPGLALLVEASGLRNGVGHRTKGSRRRHVSEMGGRQS